MEKIKSKLNEVVELLAQITPEVTNVGLLNGKLGMSIFFFELAQETQNEAQAEMAEKLVEEVYNFIAEGSVPMNFENGLAGIASGICYLAKNGFVEADLDEILEDVDDRMFKYLIANMEKIPFNLRQGLLGYLFYTLSRYEAGGDSEDDTNKYIFRRLGADLINRLGQLIEEEKFQSREPLLFTVFWDLPVLLILLAEARKLNVNPGKVDKIVDYLSPMVTSMFPRLHSNRLYLLLGMEYLLKEIDYPSWSEHADFLRGNIKPSQIIDEECKNLNILVQDGISGLDFISRRLRSVTGNNELHFSGEQVFNKISESVCWEDLVFYKGFKNSIGLFSGLSGIGMLLTELLKVERNQDLIETAPQFENVGRNS